MYSLEVWIHTARPKTLIASISPVIIGIALSYKHSQFSFTIALLTLIASLLIQIITNLFNDYYDFTKGSDTKNRKGPIRAIQSGIISPENLLKLTLSLLALSFLCSVPLFIKGGLPIFSLALLAAFLSFAYTAGPFPLAYIGLAELFAFFFFGPIATTAVVFLQTAHFSYTAFIAGVAPGLLCNVMLILNNLRDEAEDRRSNKKTLIVRFGSLFGKIEITLIYTISFLIPLILIFYTSKHFFSILASISLFPSIKMIQALFKANSPEDYQSLFPQGAILMVFYTFAFSLGWLI